MMFKWLTLCCSKYLFPRTRYKQLLKHNPDIRELFQQEAKQVAVNPLTYFLPSNHHSDHHGLWGTKQLLFSLCLM